MKTIINYYLFDISNKDQKQQYKTLIEGMKKEGIKPYTINPKQSLANEWLMPGSKEIILNLKDVHFNSWSIEPTKLASTHVYDWLEVDHTAKSSRIKEGYYLDITDSMRDFRDNNVKCSFCGHQYPGRQTGFCVECLDRVDLTEDKLHLLFLRPIATMDIQLFKNSLDVPNWLINAFEGSRPGKHARPRIVD